MGMRQVEEILVSLGGTATTAQMRQKAEEIGYGKQHVYDGLLSLERWNVVKATGPRYRKIENIVWSLTGDKIDWNVISIET